MPGNVGRALETSRCIQDYVLWDSEGERDFARDLDSAEGKVAVYAKLPRSFKILTPVGNYAPDWAIAFEKRERTLHFLCCGNQGQHGQSHAARHRARQDRLRAQALQEDVRYDVVHSYEDLLTVIQGTE